MAWKKCFPFRLTLHINLLLVKVIDCLSPLPAIIVWNALAIYPQA